jgi:hypothetical protein
MRGPTVLLALGLTLAPASPVSALQKTKPLYSVPDDAPHALVRLRIPTASSTEQGGWLVALDNVGSARIASRDASAEITLRVVPGPHVLSFLQYRHEQYPDPYDMPRGSQVNITAVFEDGGDYALELATTKLHRLGCACFVQYRVNGGDEIRSMLIRDDWVSGSMGRSLPPAPAPATGARRRIAKKLKIAVQYLPADWQDSNDADDVAGTWHEGSWEVLLRPDGSTQVAGLMRGDWRQYGNRVLLSYWAGNLLRQQFLTVENDALVGSSVDHDLDDDTIVESHTRLTR